MCYANSRRINHFAVDVFVMYGHLFAGFGRWRGRTTTAYVFSNANKGVKSEQ